ncbi:hypothetical protein JY555_14505 [Serratia marcescens]|nr:hypothetical protein [Serratia marcescens]
MSNEDLLTYLWISLENFNNSILKQEPLLKSLLPIATAFAGVLLGLFFNTLKEYIVKIKNDKSNKKLFIDEINIIKNDMESILPKLYSFMDGVIKNRELKNLIYSPKINKLGYEKFYPEVIHLFSLDEKKLIRKIYNDADIINDGIDEFSISKVSPDTFSRKEVSRDEYMVHIRKSGNLRINCVIMYISCKKLISGEVNKKISESDVLRELNIKSTYFEKFKEHIKNEANQDNPEDIESKINFNTRKFETKY